MWGRIIGSVIGSLLGGPLGMFGGHIIGGLSEELLKQVFPDISQVVAGAVGLTVGELSGEQFKKARETIVKLHETERQHVGDELQRAFRGALCEALYDVGGKECFRKEWGKKREVPPGVTYPSTARGNQLWRNNDPLAGQVCGCLHGIVQEVNALRLLPLNPPTDEPGAHVYSYLNVETPQALNDAFFTQVIVPYLATFKALLDELPDFEEHLHAHLLNCTLVHLGELLKQRTGVWRSFLKAMLEDLRTDMRQVKTGQQETLKHLNEVLNKCEEITSQAAFGQAVADLMTAVGNVEKQQGELFDALLIRVVSQHKEVIDHLSETLAGIRRIEFRLTKMEGDVRSIIPRLEEILTYIHGANLEEFTTQADRLIVKSRAIPVMLRERQANYLEGHGLFAGRSKEIAAINGFLRERTHGYIFVTGPSGYGKTALLANLVSSARERYIWYFINRLDGTHRRKAFLRQMCEQLLAYYQIPVKSEADLPVEEDQLEALYSKLLRMPLVQADQSLILVIDGIDEAEDGFFDNNLYIPQKLPDGKFIIFSSRQVEDDSRLRQDYPTKLGLPEDEILPIELKALSKTSIAALLRIAGTNATAWANDPVKLKQVKRVSEGDPFYLHYLVQDIAKGTITFEQIEQMPKGVDTYLDGWWRQVVEAMGDKNLRNLMGVLMVAIGPLPRADLFRLYPDMEWTFDRLLEPVRRFVPTTKVVSKEKGEQIAYTLCHWRFRDYIFQKKLPGKVTMYQEQLLDYCANWQESDSLYALQFYSAHLLQAGQMEKDPIKANHFYRELLTLVDESFLKAKIQHLQSYKSVLVDFKNAMLAAAALNDPVKLLGLALAYNGLQENAAQLARSGIIPLYARFGEPTLAQELASMIRDEIQDAKTRIAIARELPSSQSERALEMIDQVLDNWRRYNIEDRGYQLGEVLSEVLTSFPGALISFFEKQDDLFSLQSLVYHFFYLSDGSYYSVFHQSVPHLNELLQVRLRALLTQVLEQIKPPASVTYTRDAAIHYYNEPHYNEPSIRFLLANWEPDLNKAADLDKSEAAQIIVQAKRDRQEQEQGRLTEQTVRRTIRFFTEDKGQHKFGEEQALLQLVAAPHVEHFLKVIQGMNTAALFQQGIAEILRSDGGKGWIPGESIDALAQQAGGAAAMKKVKLLVAIGEQLAKQHNIEGAKKFLDESLKVSKEISSLLQEPMWAVLQDSASPWLVKQLAEELASENLQVALDFLESPEIVLLLRKSMGLSKDSILQAVLRAGARANIGEAITIVEQRWPDQSWTWVIIAEELARVDLERALTIWRKKLNSGEVNKSQTLINMLYNVPHKMYQRARDVLIQDFTQEPSHQLYKIPILLDIALRLERDQMGTAQSLAWRALSDLDTQNQLETAPIQAGRVLASLQMRFEKEGWTMLRREFFLVQIVPEVAECGMVELARDLLLTIKEDYGLRLIAAADLLQSLIEGQDDLTKRVKNHMDFILGSQKSFTGHATLQHGEAIAEFVERLSTTSVSLISLYLLHQAYKRTPYFSWHSDYVNALLAIKTLPFYSRDTLEFVDLIQSTEVKQLAIIDLYNTLSFEIIDQGEDLGQGVRLAIAWVRMAARESYPQKRLERIEAAFTEAEKSYKDLQDEFTLDLLFQFVREVRQRNPKRSWQFARDLIKEVLTTPRQWRNDWIAERLFELSDCGYNFSAGERDAIEQQSDQWVANWEQLGDVQQIHEYLAQLLSQMARSTMRSNSLRGLELITRAIYHANLITHQGRRRIQQQRILRFLLANRDMSMWEKAVWLSLDFGDAIFEIFDLFGVTLLTLKQEDKELPLRLKETIEWAERVSQI